MKESIDRIEGDRVVMIDDDGNQTVKPRELFAKGIEEGDVVVKQNGIYEKDAQTTEQLRREVNELLDRLIKRNERK